MNPRINVGKGVSGATRYVFGQGRAPKTGVVLDLKPGEQSRVAWFSGTGFGFEINSRADADLARRMMEFAALNQSSRTKLCEKDCVHISLSWRPGQQPTQTDMEAAAQAALKSLGMENARALFVAHNDEDYHHLHIVASKINPDTGRAYDLERSKIKLSDWALAYEREHGGVVCGRREDASELRSAIRDRDAAAVLEALTKQRSTFTPQQLHRALEKEIIRPGRNAEDRTNDRKELASFESAVLARSELVRLSDTREGPTTRYTTRTVLEAELHVLRAGEGLAADKNHAISEGGRGAILRSKQFEGITSEQFRAYRHATGAEGLAIIDGQAGTGKSFTIGAIRQTYEKAGYSVVGLAPTNAVAQDMRADGFSRAGTVHAELFALNNNRRTWDRRTVVIVDEAAMLDTKLMAMITAHAHEAGAKLILAGDDRQLSSIDRGGMFGVLKDRHGATELTEVKRQHKTDERRASEMMAQGNFNDALNIYEQMGSIQWSRTQGQARAALVEQWAKDSAIDPGKSRFVFAYTNDDVNLLNTALREVRKQRGELGKDHEFETTHGRAAFAAGDRVQFTATDKRAGIMNGHAGKIEKIEGSNITVQLDGKKAEKITFDAGEFQKFRHGYAGTIYRGQGRTLDQTYLYHSEHWRSASSYVALTRHRDKAMLFVARNTAANVKELARQMGRVDDRRAASMFHHRETIGPVRPLTARETLEKFAGSWAYRDGNEQRPQSPAQRENEFGRAPQPAPANQNETPQEQMQQFVDSLPKIEPAPNVAHLREPPTVPEKIERLWQQHVEDGERPGEAAAGDMPEVRVSASQAPPQAAERREPADQHSWDSGEANLAARPAARGVSHMAAAVEKFFSVVFNLFGGGQPKLTRQQQHDNAQAEGNEEMLQARAAAAANAARWTEQDRIIFEQDRRQQQEEREADLGYRGRDR